MIASSDALAPRQSPMMTRPVTLLLATAYACALLAIALAARAHDLDYEDSLYEDLHCQANRLWMAKLVHLHECYIDEVLSHPDPVRFRDGAPFEQWAGVESRRERCFGPRPDDCEGECRIVYSDAEGLHCLCPEPPPPPPPDVCATGCVGTPPDCACPCTNECPNGFAEDQGTAPDCECAPGEPDPVPEWCDVNGDGTVNSADYLVYLVPPGMDLNKAREWSQECQP